MNEEECQSYLSAMWKECLAEAEVQQRQHLLETEWTAASRAQYQQEHPENFASGPSKFPIKDADDVRSAATLHGHSDNPAATKHHIISIAHKLGLSDALPEEWKEAPVDGDAPLAPQYDTPLVPYPDALPDDDDDGSPTDPEQPIVIVLNTDGDDGDDDEYGGAQQ